MCAHWVPIWQSMHCNAGCAYLERSNYVLLFEHVTRRGPSCGCLMLFCSHSRPSWPSSSGCIVRSWLLCFEAMHVCIPIYCQHTLGNAGAQLAVSCGGVECGKEASPGQQPALRLPCSQIELITRLTTQVKLKQRLMPCFSMVLCLHNGCIVMLSHDTQQGHT